MADTQFQPRRGLRGGHRQTIASFLLQRRIRVPVSEERLVEVEPGVQVLCHCHWQTDRQNALTLITLHGLEGSSDSQYMLGIAEKGLAAGMNVIRMNQRNCGGTEKLAPTLYHSGRSHDVAAVADSLIKRDRISRFVLAGFSMGGNLVLKTAGEWGSDAPPQFRAVAAVCAANDPFIRILPETRKKIVANPNITFFETDDGGHCSFLADPNGYDGRWAELRIIEFLRRF